MQQLQYQQQHLFGMGAGHARAMVSNGVIVTTGLRAGDQIVVSGAKIVADGEAVEVLR